MKWCQAVLIAALAVGAAAGRAQAEDAGTPTRELFHRGAQELALVSGYGFGFQFGSENPDGDDVETVPLFLRWGVQITDPLGPGRWYEGNLALAGEATFLFNTEPRSGFAGGATVSLRYNFLRGRRFVPYFEAGAGMADIDFDIAEQSDGFSFILQTGVGVHWLVGRRTALTAGWRYQHISNAGIRNPNGGLDWNFVLLGATYFFD